MKKKPQYSRKVKQATPKPEGSRKVRIRRMDGFPKQTCQVWCGGIGQAKAVIREYRERFGVLPQIAFLCKGTRWYIPVPDEGGV